MHRGFAVLDTVPHVLTGVTILDMAAVHVVDPSAMPNPAWLHPGMAGAGQQAFGDALLERHKLVLVPSAVSVHSWNAIFVASLAAGAYVLRSQERFALDTRLHPPRARP